MLSTRFAVVPVNHVGKSTAFDRAGSSFPNVRYPTRHPRSTCPLASGRSPMSPTCCAPSGGAADARADTDADTMTSRAETATGPTQPRYHAERSATAVSGVGHCIGAAPTLPQIGGVSAVSLPWPGGLGLVWPERRLERHRHSEIDDARDA